MPIKLSGADIKNVMVAGAGAKSVRLGTGSANVEVWTSKPLPLPVQLGASSYLPFTTGAEDLGTNPQTWSVLLSDAIAGGVLAKGTVGTSPSSLPVPNDGPVALTGWVNITGTGSSASSVFRITASNLVLEARIIPNTLTLFWDRRHGATAQQTVNAGALPTGWVFLSAVMEPVSGTTWRFRHYINGVEKTNITWDAGTQSAPTSPSMKANAWDSLFALDDFAIYPVALTATQITNLYQNGRST